MRAKINSLKFDIIKGEKENKELIINSSAINDLKSVIENFIDDYSIKLSRKHIIRKKEFLENSKLMSYSTEINYLKELKKDIESKENILEKTYRIKLKNIIKKVTLRQEKYFDIKNRLESVGVLYDYNSFFDFLESIVKYQNQPILFIEEKNLYDEIEKNRMKFKNLAEKNFSTIVEKIQSKYFNKEYETFNEIDSKIKNLEKIQERFNITTLLEFTQLKRTIQTELKMITDYLGAHLYWETKDFEELFELLNKKLSVEIRIKDLRDEYNVALTEKIHIKTFLEESLISQMKEILLNINTESDYNNVILMVEHQNAQLKSDRVTEAIQEAKNIANSKDEIVTYLNKLKQSTSLSTEEKIQLIKPHKVFRNIEKFDGIKEEINTLKKKILDDLNQEFNELIKNNKLFILDSFNKNNENLNFDSKIQNYIGLSKDIDEKINSLNSLKESINPLKAKMRVISMQPDSLQKLRSIEKFHKEILKNNVLDSKIKNLVLSFFDVIYEKLVKNFEIKSYNYDLNVVDKINSKLYKIITRDDHLIKIGRKNMPSNDIVLLCRKISKEYLVLDLNKKNIINYQTATNIDEKTYKKSAANNKLSEEISKIKTPSTLIEIAGVLEGELKNLNDNVFVFNFTKVYDIDHCNECEQIFSGCKGCSPEYIKDLKNTTFIFYKDYTSFYIDESNSEIILDTNSNSKSLKIEMDKKKIFVEFGSNTFDKHLISNDYNDFFEEYAFKLELINQTYY